MFLIFSRCLIIFNDCFVLLHLEKLLTTCNALTLPQVMLVQDNLGRLGENGVDEPIGELCQILELTPAFRLVSGNLPSMLVCVSRPYVVSTFLLIFLSSSIMMISPPPIDQPNLSALIFNRLHNSSVFKSKWSH